MTKFYFYTQDGTLVGLTETGRKYVKEHGSIKLPDGIEAIGKFAFYGNKDLKHVELPKSLQIIHEGAFKRTGLTEIDIPNRVYYIGAFAFAQNKDLKSVKIPNYIVTIQPCAFASCTMLEKLYMPAKANALSICTFFGDEKLGDYRFSDVRFTGNATEEQKMTTFKSILLDATSDPIKKEAGEIVYKKFLYGTNKNYTKWLMNKPVEIKTEAELNK